MGSLTRWTWVWVNSGSLWWTGRPGILWFMGSQRVGHDWATELNWWILREHSHLVYCFCSVVQLCLTLCHPMDCSTPGLPLFHCLPDFAQIHIHGVRHAIQPSYPLLPFSPFAFSLSQPQSLAYFYLWQEKYRTHPGYVLKIRKIKEDIINIMGWLGSQFVWRYFRLNFEVYHQSFSTRVLISLILGVTEQSCWSSNLPSAWRYVMSSGLTDKKKERRSEEWDGTEKGR